ncbi:MAG: response regulator transcription factor [Lachnospiraceae bacterium]|nr:response regulator transcription factor [Lachnospiraceae bacterium]MBO7632311.1 response regulator transcription factor [Lachnospiraceae bacterium]
MIIIGICDDEEEYRAQIRTLCSAFFDAQKQECGFVEFPSGEDVLAYQGDRIHLLFLDIEMPGTGGLEVLTKVRGNDRFWRIVFVTSHKELKWDTVDLKTLAFLEKPIDRLGVETCLKTILRENRENIDISYKMLKGTGHIRLDQVISVQARGNYVSICSEKEEIPGYDSIKVIEEQTAGTTLVRTHKSYLANLQFVKKINGDGLLMTNGTVVPVGRKYLAAVKEAYFSFLRSVTIDRNR